VGELRRQLDASRDVGSEELVQLEARCQELDIHAREATRRAEEGQWCLY
jgi:hypothetical protein